MKILKVAIVEDDRRYRAGLETLFRHAPSFELAESFESAATAVSRVEALTDKGDLSDWDVVLMDIDTPRLNGIEATRRIKAHQPDLAVVMLTVFEEPRTILEAICAGADGYLLKRSSAKELLSQVRNIGDGGAPLTSGVAKSVLEMVRRFGPAPEGAPATSPAQIGLTNREQEVLKCLVDGNSYKETASELGISIDTVRTHIRSLYKKLQVKNVSAAVTRALRDRLV